MLVVKSVSPSSHEEQIQFVLLVLWEWTKESVRAHRLPMWHEIEKLDSAASIWEETAVTLQSFLKMMSPIWHLLSKRSHWLVLVMSSTKVSLNLLNLIEWLWFTVTGWKSNFRILFVWYNVECKNYVMKTLERQSFHILNKMYEYMILIHGSHNISLMPRQRNSGSMTYTEVLGSRTVI